MIEYLRQAQAALRRNDKQAAIAALSEALKTARAENDRLAASRIFSALSHARSIPEQATQLQAAE